MRDVIDQASDLDCRSRSPIKGRAEETEIRTKAIPDIWLAAILIPVIVGCTLFAATGS